MPTERFTRTGASFLVAWAAAALVGSATADDGDPLEVPAEDLRPGLAAVYRSPAGGETLSRIDVKPAFTLGHSSPHPRIPPGPFEVVWTGLLNFTGGGPVTFGAYVGGEVTVILDGTAVLRARGETDTAWMQAKEPLQIRRGLHRLRIEYRSLAGVPARLQLWWEGKGFSREPIPGWLYKHVIAERPESAMRDELAEAGRAAAGRLGCARCHASAFPGAASVPPGPSLADVGRRVNRAWLLNWLEDPANVRPGAHMPALFAPDRRGLAERTILADFLLRGSEPRDRRTAAAVGDHREGRKQFLKVGCVACHRIPDPDKPEAADPGRSALAGLNDRYTPADLAEFLSNPAARYPDGRHPRQPLGATVVRDIAAYVAMWSKPATADSPAEAPATKAEIDDVVRKLGGGGSDGAARTLLREKGCIACHTGLGGAPPNEIPIRGAEKTGCLSGNTGPRFELDKPTCSALSAYRIHSERDRHPSPVETRRQMIDRLGCFRCHTRDSDRPPPLEVVGSTLGGSNLEAVPFLRTPRLTNALSKYSRSYLIGALSDGVAGVRQARFSYRMPEFGHDAETILQALAEFDGDLADSPPPDRPPPADPTIHMFGAPLAGFEGYSCVSCHIWQGKQLNEPDPGAIGPELTSVTRRVRRDWFDRWLDDPGRSHPGTVMPQVFFKGSPAGIKSVLDGDPAKQKDALWAYLALGKDAPSPKPLPPIPVTLPPPGAAPLVALIPIALPDKTVVESLTIAWGNHDALVFDIGAGALREAFTGAQILRSVRGRQRSYAIAGTSAGVFADTAFQPFRNERGDTPTAIEFLGYDRLPDGARVRCRLRFGDSSVETTETLRMNGRTLLRELRVGDLPKGAALDFRVRIPEKAKDGGAAAPRAARSVMYRLTVQNPVASVRSELPPAADPVGVAYPTLADPGRPGGPLERPGYRAIAYPRPKTVTGEDLVMPVAVAAHPKDGRVFIASMKVGELFVLRDPHDNGVEARFENYGGGLFQEAYSMLAEEDALYVLHRRNLTRIADAGPDALPTRFDRVAGLPQGISESYDYGYGLVRDKSGAFVITQAPHANRTIPGSGNALRLPTSPTGKAEEFAYGFRNPLGWCTGPDGDVFFTDNQGEWVATNKLSVVGAGRYHGYPNIAQKQHAAKPFQRPAVWVPYGWARSINGVAFDRTGGKFGPFAGQFFLAELMYGGAIIRADVEKVNGEYQGVCFPFWGQGLLGPVTLAFDPRGRLFVGGITEPGWMAQPDRGGLFRIDFTGETPFEIRTIRVRPQGFRLEFTKPVDAKTAAEAAAYSVERYRYEYTGAYGSPELDRSPVPISKVALSADGLSAELTTAPLVKDWIYLISARGVRSAKGEPPVQPTGAYTLNEIPKE